MARLQRRITEHPLARADGQRSMAETHTLSGLTTTVAVLEKDYPTQRRVEADYKSTMNIRFDKRLPKWNYQAQSN